MGVKKIETMPIVDALEAHIGATDELSQNRAAKKLGVSTATMSHWIRGVVTPTPTPERVQGLSELLGISTAEVLRGFGYEVSDEEPVSVSGALGPYLNSDDPAAHNVHPLDAHGQVIEGPWGDGPDDGTPVQMRLPRAA